MNESPNSGKVCFVTIIIPEDINMGSKLRSQSVLFVHLDILFWNSRADWRSCPHWKRALQKSLWSVKFHSRLSNAWMPYLLKFLYGSFYYILKCMNAHEYEQKPMMWITRLGTPTGSRSLGLFQFVLLPCTQVCSCCYWQHCVQIEFNLDKTSCFFL